MNYAQNEFHPALSRTSHSWPNFPLFVVSFSYYSLIYRPSSPSIPRLAKSLFEAPSHDKFIFITIVYGRSNISHVSGCYGIQASHSNQEIMHAFQVWFRMPLIDLCVADPVGTSAAPAREGSCCRLGPFPYLAPSSPPGMLKICSSYS